MKPPPLPTQDEMAKLVAEAEDWKWSSLRSFAIGLDIWPIEWGLGGHRTDDRHGGHMSLALGPFEFYFRYNDGSMLR